MSRRLGNKWKNLGAVALCALALIAGWQIHNRSTAPLRQQEAEILSDVADLKERIAGARKAFAEIRAQEASMTTIRAELMRLEGERRAGSPIVWVPALVKEHFARSGTAVLLTRLNTTQDMPNLPGYARGFWSTALPIDEAGGNIATITRGVVDLEQQNPCVRVLDFAICPDPEHPSRRVALMNLTVLIRK